jgi:hypothetical protein
MECRGFFVEIAPALIEEAHKNYLESAIESENVLSLSRKVL